MMTESQEGTKLIKPFEPLEWQKSAWKSKAPTLLLAGSAGTGKSHLAANKIHGFMLKYPNSTGLILRKVRSAAMNSTLAFMQRSVIGDHPGVRWRPTMFRFEYPNGSILVLGGMRDDDQREHIRSIGQQGGLEIAWIEEANQFTESDYNEVLGRMRGTAAPWRQIMLTTNPEGPNHWIYQNLIIPNDETVDVYQPPVDSNPHNPPEYLDTLRRLTGVQYDRLFLGKWVQASGIVFDNWIDREDDPRSNVTFDAEYIPDGGPVYWWADDGITGELKNGLWTEQSHPRAILFVQERPDGTLAIFNESYKAGLIASEHISQLLEITSQNGWAYPEVVVRDRAAASLGMALSNHGLKEVFNNVKVEESIKELRNFIEEGDVGIRRLLCHPRCKFFRTEMQSYARNERTGRIVKAHDHGVDAARYGVWHYVAGAPGDVDVAAYSIEPSKLYTPEELAIRDVKSNYSDVDVAGYSI